MRLQRFSILAVAIGFLGWNHGWPIAACDICPGGNAEPLSRSLQQTPIVIFGSITDAQLATDGIRGTSEFKIEAVLKDSDKLKNTKTITIYKYVQPHPQIKYLAFADLVGNQVDVYRSLQFNNDRIVKYLQEAPKDKPGVKVDAKTRLRYYFDFLNDPERAIAFDAFLEWATASNQDVCQIAPTLPAESIRKWLLDPKTETNRLGLYAYLLAACGNDQDVLLLKQLLDQPGERFRPALDGILAGYIHMKPKEGWEFTKQFLVEPNRQFVDYMAVLRMLRFVYANHADTAKPMIIECMGLMLQNPFSLDLAIDQLRRWQIWSHTDPILKHYHSTMNLAPITKRAILRYALSCPEPNAKSFIERVRAQDSQLVKEIEEDLQLDRIGK